MNKMNKKIDVNKIYGDIINEKWPRETLRSKMPLKNRAKIFLPFAALKGYEESLDVVRQLVEEDSSDADRLCY